MEHSMKMRLVIVALGTVLAAPAFAQTPNSRQDPQTTRRSSKVPVHAPDNYVRQYGNGDNTVLGEQPWWRTQNWCDARGVLFLCR
jgi:hypothetical protein